MKRLSISPRGAAALCVSALAVAVFIMFFRQIVFHKTLVPVDILYLLNPWNNLHTGPAQNHIVSDAVREGFPWMSFATDWLNKGTVAWWSPMIFSGVPVSTTFFPIFFPLIALFLFLSPIDAYTYMIIIQVFLAGVFMFILLRELDLLNPAALAGGFTFMFSEVLVHWSENFVNTSSMMWLPLEMFLATRLFRTKHLYYAGLLAVVLAINVFGSQFQFLYFSMVIFAVYCVYLFGRGIVDKICWPDLAKRAGLFILAGGLGVGISLVQLLPMLELTKHVARSGETVEAIAGSVLHWRQIVTFLVPNFYGSPIDGTSWVLNLEWFMDSGYVGILPLFLAVIGILFSKKRGKMFFGVIATLALILTFIPTASKILYYLMPLYNRFRGAARWIFVYAYAMSALTAFGIDAVLEYRAGRGASRSALLKAAASVGITAVVIVAAGLTKLIISNPDLPRAFFSYEMVQIAIFLLVLVISGGALFIYVRRPDRYAWGAYGLAGLIVVNVLSLGFSFYPAVSKAESFPVMPGIRYLQTRQGQFRVMRFEGNGKELPSNITPTLTPNSLMVYRVQDAQGSCPFQLKRYAEFNNLIENHGDFAKETNAVPSIQQKETINSPLLDLLNVKYILSLKEINDPDLEKVYDKELKIYLNKDALTRAYIVYDWQVTKTTAATRKALKDPRFDPRTKIIVERKPDSEPSLGIKGNAAVVSKYEPNLVEVKAMAAADGFLFMSDNYYPGWTVTVDGKKAELYRADYTFRGVFLRRGKHIVRFSYEPIGLETGILASGLAIFGAILLIVAGIGGSIKRRLA